MRAVLVAVISTLLLAGSLHAAELSAEDKAMALYDAGQKAYDTGHFPEALKSFQEAYAAAPEPALLFNIGQCFRKMKDHAHAAAAFERYLHDATDIPNKKEVTDLAREESKLAAKAGATHVDAAAVTPAPVTPAPTPDVTPPVPDAAPLAAETAKAPEPAAADEPPWQNPLVWGATAGVAAIVAGTAVVAAIVLQPPPPKAGSLGTIDLR